MFLLKILKMVKKEKIWVINKMYVCFFGIVFVLLYLKKVMIDLCDLK